MKTSFFTILAIINCLPLFAQLNCTIEVNPIECGKGNINLSINGGEPVFNVYLNGMFHSKMMTNDLNISVQNPGQYEVKVIDESNNDFIQLVEVPVSSIQNLDITTKIDLMNLSKLGSKLNSEYKKYYIKVSVAGGTAPYTYSLNGINFKKWFMFTNLREGSYTVYVKDATGCIEKIEVVVPDNVEPPVDDPEPTDEMTIVGQIFDDLLQSVGNATCTCTGLNNEEIIQTDSEGNFSFTGELEGNRVVIQCKKETYLTSTYAFRPTDADSQYVKMKLQPRVVTETIDAQEGGFIRNHLGMVHLRPNSIADENGNLYEGEVYVHFKHHTPDDEWYGLSMPGGDFLAKNENGDEVMLYSYGVLEAELTTPTGEPLNIAAGHTAKLYYVIVPEQWNTAPDSIPLWYFDESEKYWLQEGWAYRESNTYVTEVSHFSAWNCDWQGPRATVRGNVIDCHSEPAAGYPILLGKYNNIVYTDENGYFEAWIPATIPIEIPIGDTLISIPILTEGEIYEIPDTISNVVPLIAYSIINEENEISIYVHGGEPPFLFSIDNGLTFQSESTFTIDPNEIPCVLVKGTCDELYRACQVYDLLVQDCSVSSNGETYTDFNSIMVAIAQRKTVDDIDLSNQDLNVFPTELTMITPCLKT